MDNKSTPTDLLDFKSYKKYIDLIKIYYDKHNICPTNSKLKLNKKYDKNKILLNCDNNKFSYEIILPEYINIYNELYNLRKLRNKCLTFFKSAIIYGEDTDKFSEYKKKYIDTINKIEKFDIILTNDSKYIINLDKKMLDLKENLDKIYKNRLEYFDKLKHIDIKTKRKIIILYSKEYPLSDDKIEKYRKSLNISFENLKNWLLWVSMVKKYVITINDYNINYLKYKNLISMLSEKNNSWMVIDPIIIDKTIGLKMTEKYKNKKKIKDIKNKTSGEKKIKIK